MSDKERLEMENAENGEENLKLRNESTFHEKARLDSTQPETLETNEYDEDQEDFSAEEREQMQDQINKLTDLLTTKVLELDTKDKGGA